MNNNYSIDMEFEEGTGYSIEIVDEIDGFLISYHKLDFNDRKLPDDEIKSLVKRIKGVVKELNVQASRFLVEIISDGGRVAACNVNKQKEIVHLVLPVYIDGERIIIPSRGIDENYILYHELMHAKDVLEGNSPSVGMIDAEDDFPEYLRGFAQELSIEGRLENYGKPHYSRDQAIENVYQCLLDDFSVFGWKTTIDKKFFVNLCDKVWGKELKSDECDAIINELLG